MPQSSPEVTDPRFFFRIWRDVTLEGDRRVLEGVLHPEHVGPAPGLAAFLAGWKGAWYWGDDARSRLVLIHGTAPARPERWLWHGALLVLTIICTLGAGAIVAGQLYPPSRPGLFGALEGAWDFGRFLWGGGWDILGYGWTFGVPLLLILLIHELGHYFTARRYAIDVSPPYFLPVPPNLSPIGGLGAFIRLRSPVYDRRQLLDVGAAGPLAGFVVAFGVLLWGLPLSERIPIALAGDPSVIALAGHRIVLGESLLTHFLREWLVPGQGPVALSPEAFAGWVGMFVTGLNLLPLSQLDGGHVLYGLYGDRQRWIAFATVIGLLVLAPRAPVWYLWVVLSFVIGRGGWSHPDVVVPGRPVTRTGRWIGIISILVFLATFVPIPFRP